MNYLFSTKNGFKHLIKFLKIIKITIKKCLLNDIDNSNVERKITTWKNLKKQININKIKIKNKLWLKFHVLIIKLWIKLTFFYLDLNLKKMHDLHFVLNLHCHNLRLHALNE